MSEYLESPKTEELIQAIILEENLSRKSDLLYNQVVAKGKVKTLTDGTRVPACVWMHPYLFIDFALWLNPSFKVKGILNIAKNDIIKPKKGKGEGIRSWSSSLILYDLDFKYYFLPIVVNRCLTCQ